MIYAYVASCDVCLPRRPARRTVGSSQCPEIVVVKHINDTEVMYLQTSMGLEVKLLYVGADDLRVHNAARLGVDGPVALLRPKALVVALRNDDQDEPRPKKAMFAHADLENSERT